MHPCNLLTDWLVGYKTTAVLARLGQRSACSVPKSLSFLFGVRQVRQHIAIYASSQRCSSVHHTQRKTHPSTRVGLRMIDPHTTERERHVALTRSDGGDGLCEAEESAGTLDTCACRLGPHRSPCFTIHFLEKPSAFFQIGLIPVSGIL
jgi:hypothetical protein